MKALRFVNLLNISQMLVLSAFLAALRHGKWTTLNRNPEVLMTTAYIRDILRSKDGR